MGTLMFVQSVSQFMISFINLESILSHRKYREIPSYK